MTIRARGCHDKPPILGTGATARYGDRMQVTRVRVHPVKSFAGNDVRSAVVERRMVWIGFVDRHGVRGERVPVCGV